MAKKVSIKKLLREEDAFLTTSEKALLYFRRNTRKISLIIAMIVALAIVGYIVKSVHDSKVAKALDAFHEATLIADTAGRNEALQAVRTDYPGTKAARQAAYALLNNFINSSDLEEALPLIDELIKTIDSAEESLRPLLLTTQAGLLEEAGQLDLAMAQYKAAIAVVDDNQGGANGDTYLSELYFSLGRVATALGQTGEAKRAYENIILSSPDSYRSYVAQVKLAQLAAPVDEVAAEGEAQSTSQAEIVAPEAAPSSGSTETSGSDAANQPADSDEVSQPTGSDDASQPADSEDASQALSDGQATESQEPKD